MSKLLPRRQSQHADRKERIKKISVSLDTDLARRIRQIAYQHEISKSAIVEVAVRRLFGAQNDDAIASILVRGGARLRRE